MLSNEWLPLARRLVGLIFGGRLVVKLPVKLTYQLLAKALLTASLKLLIA